GQRDDRLPAGTGEHHRGDEPDAARLPPEPGHEAGHELGRHHRRAHAHHRLLRHEREVSRDQYHMGMDRFARRDAGVLVRLVRPVPQERVAVSAFALDGRTAIVTGASRGIGAAIAGALDDAGARVALVARSGSELQGVAAALKHEPVVVMADLGAPDGPDVAAGRALEAFAGRVDILVNNAGAVLRKDTEELTAAELDTL